MEGANPDSIETNQVRKRKRGNTVGAKWKKLRDQKGGRLVVEIPSCLRRVVGDNAQQFITETSYLVKQYCPLNVQKWAAIDQDVKVKLMNKVKEMYVLPDEAYVNYVMRNMLMKRYRD